jgi:Zn-dependent alcohol dehydrogenase
MGFLMLLAARAAGASRLVMTGLGADQQRLAVAESLGATTVVIDQHDPVAMVQDLTNGLGADVVDWFLRLKSSEVSRHEAAEDKAEWDRREYFGRL